MEQDHRDRIILRRRRFGLGAWLSAIEEANQKWLEEGGIDLKRAMKARIDGESWRIGVASTKKRWFPATGIGDRTAAWTKYFHTITFSASIN